MEYGIHHATTLSARTDLAITLHHAGCHEEGTAMNKELWALTEKILGPKHPITLKNKRNYQVTLDQHTEEGLVELDEMARDTEGVLGPAHRDTIWAKTNKAQALRIMDRDEATEVEAEVCAALEQMDPDSMETINAQRTYAHNLMVDGRLEEARKM